MLQAESAGRVLRDGAAGAVHEDQRLELFSRTQVWPDDLLDVDLGLDLRLVLVFVAVVPVTEVQVIGALVALNLDAGWVARVFHNRAVDRDALDLGQEEMDEV